MKAKAIECEPVAWKSNDAFRTMSLRHRSKNGQPVRVMHRTAPRCRRAKCPATDLRSVEEKKSNRQILLEGAPILSSAVALFASSRQTHDTITPQAGPPHERGASHHPNSPIQFDHGRNDMQKNPSSSRFNRITPVQSCGGKYFARRFLKHVIDCRPSRLIAEGRPPSRCAWTALLSTAAMQRPIPEHLTRARGFFERALALDPRNIEALVGMAFVDTTMATDLLVDDRTAPFLQPKQMRSRRFH